MTLIHLTAQASSSKLSDKAVIYSYTKLKDLRVGTDICFYGLVTHYKEPFLSRGTDYCMSLSIIDETLPQSSTASAAIPVVIFSPDRNRLPIIKGCGDVVQFRHFRIQPYNDTLQALSMRHSAWIVYSRDSLSGEWAANPAHDLRDAELRAIENIHARATSNAVPKEISNIVYDSQDPINRLLKVREIKPGTFFDLVAQVWKRYSNARSNHAVLLLTDYSENDLIKWEIDEPAIPKFLLKRLLSVSFWDNFAAFSGTLKEGQVIKCRNLHAKMFDGKLVAVMHGARDISAQDSIIVCGETSVEANKLNRRRENLEKQYEMQKNSIEMTTIKKRDNIPVSSIMTVLSSEGQCGVVCIEGRVTDIKPKSLRDKGMKKFMFQMALRDETGELPVIVQGEEACKFLSCTPEDYGTEQEDALERLLSSLLPSRFLLKMYTVRSRRRFQLFDTVLNA